MREQAIILLAAVAIASQSAFAQVARPILIGDGRDTVSSETIGQIAQLVAAVAGKDTRLWMLHCDTYKQGRNVGQVFRVTAYFTPRVVESRLIRGQSIVCLDSTISNYWNKSSPVIGGWYSGDKDPADFALVIPSGTTLGTNAPAEKPFTIRGTIQNAEVVNVIDAVRSSVTNQTILQLEATDATRARVRTSQGSGWQGLRIDLEKDAAKWKETRRRKWVY